MHISLCTYHGILICKRVSKMWVSNGVAKQTWNLLDCFPKQNNNENSSLCNIFATALGLLAKLS